MGGICEKLRLSGCKGRIFITVLLLCQVAVLNSPWEKKCVLGKCGFFWINIILWRQASVYKVNFPTSVFLSLMFLNGNCSSAHR